MAGLRKIAQDNDKQAKTEVVPFKVESAGFRSRDPQQVATFMQEHFNRGFTLLTVETHQVDVVYEIESYAGDGKMVTTQHLGKDIETIVFMNRVTGRQVGDAALDATLLVDDGTGVLN